MGIINSGMDRNLKKPSTSDEKTEANVGSHFPKSARNRNRTLGPVSQSGTQSPAPAPSHICADDMCAGRRGQCTEPLTPDKLSRLPGSESPGPGCSTPSSQLPLLCPLEQPWGSNVWAVPCQLLKETT